MVKTPNVLGVPILFDRVALEEADVARENLDTAAQNLLKTFISRRDQRVALNGGDLEDAAREVYAEDQMTLAGLAEVLEVAQAKLAAGTVIYQFRSLGYKAWRALKAAHPSTDKTLAFDEESIAPTLLREASHDPKLSAEMVDEILNSPDWSEGEVHLLLRAAVGAQS